MPEEENWYSGSHPDEWRTAPNEEDARSRRSRRVVLLVLILGVVMALGVWSYISRPTPEETAAQSFVKAAMSGSYSAVAPHLSRATLAKIGRSAKAKTRFVEQWREFLTGGFVEPSQAEFEIGGCVRESPSIARVRAKLADDSDVLAYMRRFYPGFADAWLMMVREDGKWKFDSARTIDRIVINPAYCEENACLVE